MNEKELRAVAVDELERKDIIFTCTGFTEIGKVVYDYDMGLSVVNKRDPDDCLVGIHGPSYKGVSNYRTKKAYHKDLETCINMLKDGFFKSKTFFDELGIGKPSQDTYPACPFN